MSTDFARLITFPGNKICSRILEKGRKIASFFDKSTQKCTCAHVVASIVQIVALNVVFIQCFVEYFCTCMRFLHVSDEWLNWSGAWMKIKSSRPAVHYWLRIGSFRISVISFFRSQTNDQVALKEFNGHFISWNSIRCTQKWITAPKRATMFTSNKFGCC